MPMVIITAEVQDPVKWMAMFRTHGDLFRSYALRATGPFHDGWKRSCGLL